MEYRDRIWELLAKQAEGQLNADEESELHSLLKEENEEVHYMMGVLGNYTRSINDAPESDDILRSTKQWRNKIMAELKDEKRESGLSSHKKAPFLYKQRWRIGVAAAVVLFLIGVWMFRQMDQNPFSSMNVVTTKSGSKTQVALPDGTQVWLNSDSRLSYSNDFKNARIRSVNLSGEAYFKVKHDSHHPFVIHTEYLNIKDLGTAFNVRAYPEEDKSEATLIEGSITVSLKNDPGKNLQLKPGEKVLYFVSKDKWSTEKNKSNSRQVLNTKISSIKHPKRLEVTQTQPVIVKPGDTVQSETAWLNNQLIFKNESFSELAFRMARWYGVEFQIKNKKVRNYSFTGVFQGETLEEAMEELQMIRPFTFSINKNKVIIKP